MKLFKIGNMRMQIAISILLLCFATSLSAESIFPLMKDIVPKNKQDELPRPYGVNYVFFEQRFISNVKEYGIGIGNKGGDKTALLSEVEIDTVTTNHSARLDFWLFPFLNLYGLAGFLTTDVTMYGEADDSDQPVFSPIAQSTVDNGSVFLTGEIYSIGAIFGYAYEQVFLSANYSHTWYNLEGRDSSSADNLILRIGYTLKNGLNPYVGYSFQRISSTRTETTTEIMEGSPPLTIIFETEKPAEWTPVVGLEMNLFDDRIQIALEGGVYKRYYYTANVGYRF